VNFNAHDHHELNAKIQRRDLFEHLVRDHRTPCYTNDPFASLVTLHLHLHRGHAPAYTEEAK
jgi:hypothetical protein